MGERESERGRWERGRKREEGEIGRERPHSHTHPIAIESANFICTYISIGFGVSSRRRRRARPLARSSRRKLCKLSSLFGMVAVYKHVGNDNTIPSPSSVTLY